MLTTKQTGTAVAGPGTSLRIGRAFPLLGILVALAWAAPAAAQNPGGLPAGGSGDFSDGSPVAQAPTPSIQSSLGPYGDPGGVRAALAKSGITYNAIYTGEVFSNVSGGIRRGTVYEGKLELNTTWDLGKVLGLPNLTFFTNGFQIHPTSGISRKYVGNFQTISAIEALPATRLSELWLEQKLFNGQLGIRVGQLAADSEFFIASYSLPFIDSDYPAISKQNQPGGGPAYPLSQPGIRVRFDPNKDVSLLAAVFDGNPAGRSSLPPEVANRTGTVFPTSDPALLMQEGQYRYNQGDKGLAGIVRLGAWEHLGSFADRRFDTVGTSLASPLSSGAARLLRGDWGLYGIIDQQIWRAPGGDLNSGVTAFGRISASPSDRNLIRFYLDGGILFAGFVPGRPDDVFGATFLLSEVSRDLRALDRDTRIVTGLPTPLRDREIAVELTYVAQIRPGWSVQPDFQYIIHPGGHVPGPDGVTPLKDATVLGLRTTITY